MKSSFVRSFTTAMLILLLALISLGTVFQYLARNYLAQSTMDSLEKEASSVAHLAASYADADELEDMGFYMNLEICARVSDTDILVCGTDGRILLCSESPFTCRHKALTISEDFMKTVNEEGVTRFSGTISGVYEDSRYLAAVPIQGEDGTAFGFVLASCSGADATSVLTQLESYFLYIAIAVTLVSFPIITVMSGRESKPLRDMAKAANSFAHGDLDARVRVEDSFSDEVRDLAAAFNNMASSLQKSEYQRQEFVANVSHELKTPMTTIAGYVDGILDGTIPEGRRDHYLRIVSDETKRLSRLVRSMLDISQLQSSSGIPDEKKISFDMEECAGQVLLTFEQKIEGKGLNVEVDFPEHPVYTFADRDAVTQIIYNLVDNAVKFCPDGGTLGLRIVQRDNKVWTSVCNDGKTIPPEELPLVFDRFHKLDKSRSENRDGWGLGLYIVKTLVCAHGEDIGVTSRDGVTEFTFTMPLIN